MPDYIEANPKQRSTNCLLRKKCLCADTPIIKGLAEYDSRADAKNRNDIES
jgi:hypothetical protein